MITANVSVVAGVFIDIFCPSVHAIGTPLVIVKLFMYVLKSYSLNSHVQTLALTFDNEFANDKRYSLKALVVGNDSSISVFGIFVSVSIVVQSVPLF